MLHKSRSPLEPLATVVRATLGVMGVLMAITALATVFGSGSIMGIGEPSVSVDVPDIVGSSDLQLGQWGLHNGVSPNTTGFRFFTVHPDVWQHLWYTLTML